MNEKNNAQLRKKLIWRCSKKRGIKLIEPNENLSQEYIKKAEDTLDAVHINKGAWKIITAYYACYNALYSILMKIGVKSEVHDCAIELMKLIDGFDSEDIIFLTKLKDDREQVQYYLKEMELNNEADIKEFILKCKSIADNLDIGKIRLKLKEVSK